MSCEQDAIFKHIMYKILSRAQNGEMHIWPWKCQLMSSGKTQLSVSIILSEAGSFGSQLQLSGPLTSGQLS